MTSSDTSLGATLRTWRDRLAPADVGLPAGFSRRAVGLRREELADLAGLSVDYVVRLEQGRATTPSAQVVGSLARALQLTREERDHLFRLAGLRPPGDERVSDHIPPGVGRLLARLGEIAVAVFAADWRLVWWSPAWAALLGDPSAEAPEARSLVLARFPLPDVQGRLEAWPVRSANPEATDRAVVADLRRASARYPDDRRLAELLRRLLVGNPRFAELWSAGAVGEHVEDRKTVEHPAVGEITVDCDVLTAGDSDLKIVTLTAAPGSEEASKLELTRIGGVVHAS